MIAFCPRLARAAAEPVAWAVMKSDRAWSLPLPDSATAASSDPPWKTMAASCAAIARTPVATSVTVRQVAAIASQAAVISAVMIPARAAAATAASAARKVPIATAKIA